LVHVSAVATPFDGYFQKERYIYEKESGTRDGTPLSLMRVRSLIVAPNDGAVVSSGPVEVSGIAWSGFGAIKRVQVSADVGKAWTQATLEPRKSDYDATLWRLTWAPPASGHYTLVARATDSAGHTQPVDPVYNLHGYGNNIAYRIHVTVK
ncbi:MAG: Ig-like domain-containing protein, partial [bacterium]